MKDVMIDLETLSTQPNATILAIGAQAFDRTTGQLGESFQILIDPKSCTDAGLHIDPMTVMWWLDQSKEAQNRLKVGARLPLGEALNIFGNWLHHHLEPGFIVWGNGSTFDNVIMHSAYLAAGKSVSPWSHRQDHCFRTMKANFPVPEDPFEGIVHDALADARHQAKHLCKIFASLRVPVIAQ